MVDKALAKQASFGEDTLSQREAAVRLFDQQEGFTEQNKNLKQEPTKPERATRPIPDSSQDKRPTRTRDRTENTKTGDIDFGTRKPIELGRGVQIPRKEVDTFSVRMKDGTLVKNVPEGATKREVFDVFNKARGFTSVQGLDPGFIQKTGDFFKDVGQALKAEAGDFRIVAMSRAIFENDTTLAPEFDSNGSFQGFKKLNKRATAELREAQHLEYVKSLRSFDEESGAALTAKVVGTLLDPTVIGPLMVGGGLGTFQRFGQILAAETVAATGGAVAKKANRGEQLNPLNVAEAGLEGLQAGTELAALDGAFGVALQVGKAGLGWYNAARISAKNSPKALSKSLDKLQDEVTNNVQKGFNPRQATLRAMETTGQTFKGVKKATDELNRGIDLTGQKLRLLPNRIKKATGVNKIHFPKGLETLVTPLSSVIRDINGRVFGRLRKHDFGVAQREGTSYAEVQSFLARGQKGLVDRTLNATGVRASGLKGEVKLLDGRVVNAEQHLKGLVLNGDAAQVRKLGQDIGDPKLYPAYLKARKMLDNVQKEMIEVGLLDKGLKDFFPRIVKDVDGLKAALGKKNLTAIDVAVDKATQTKGAPLDSTEMSAIINRFVTGRSREITPGRKLKSARTVDVIPSKLLPFYDDLNTSLVRYVDDTAKMIERKKFFGDFSNRGKTIANSVSDLLASEVHRGHMLASDIPKLHGLLESRFVHGVQGPGKFTQNVRNIFYASTLGQVTNAATQLADLGIGAFINGADNTVRALARSNRRVLPEHFNLTRKIAEDFSSTEGTAKVLSNVLHTTGFKFVDRMGKTVNMNAAILKAEGQVQSEKGLQAFRKEWSPIYGKETEKLIRDLQGKKLTENVKLLAFNKLADAQPISLSEMPQTYLNVNNGRILYALNTFTIKQLDLMRRTAVREMLHGDSIKGATQLARFSMMFGAANLGVAEIKDIMRGRERPIDDKVIDSLYKNFGTSEYIVDRGLGGQAQQAVVNSLMPIFSLVDTAATATETVSGFVKGNEDWGKQMHLLANKIPLGQMFYDWFGGGIEEFREKQETKENREQFGEDDEE